MRSFLLIEDGGMLGLGEYCWEDCLQPRRWQNYVQPGNGIYHGL